MAPILSSYDAVQAESGRISRRSGLLSFESEGCRGSGRIVDRGTRGREGHGAAGKPTCGQVIDQDFIEIS